MKPSQPKLSRRVVFAGAGTAGVLAAAAAVLPRQAAEVADLLEGKPRPQFDLDHYKILTRHVRAGRARIVELAGSIRQAAH